MSVLIVGGDHLGSIPKELKKIGVDDIRHMDGRNRNVIKRNSDDNGPDYSIT